MRTYKIDPTQFDGAKFEARYSLSGIRAEFFIDGEGNLVVPDDFPDDPPVIEPPDPPGKLLSEMIDEAMTLEELKTVLKEAAATSGRVFG